MKDQERNKEQLVKELAERRPRVAGTKPSAAERKLAEEALERRMKALSALNAVATILSQTQDVDEFLNRALDSVQLSLGLNAAGIFLLDKGKDELALIAHRGLSDEFVKTVSRLKLGEGLTGQAAQTGQAVVRHGLSGYSSAQKAVFEKYRFQSLASVPLVGASGVIGAMSLASCASHYFNTDVLELLVSLGRQIGAGVEKVRLSREAFMDIADSAGDGILITVGEGIHVYANKRTAAITGYSIAELLKLTTKDLAHPDEFEKITETCRARMAGQPVSRQYETVFVRKDGESVLVELTAAKTAWQGQPAMIIIIRDVTEHKRMDDETVERLHALNESKSRFVAEASHELRTPLGIIREFVSLVHDEVAGPLNAQQKKWLVFALSNIDRMTELINKMLDLTRIEAGRIEVNRVKSSLMPLLLECQHNFSVICQSKKQSISLEVPGELPNAYCDLTNIRNALTNLMGNAHKFTPEGGIIRLQVKPAERFLQVIVEDNGPGISPEAQSRLFEAFYQVNCTDGPGAKGSGLGLTITKHLVELNGGTISVDSAPGAGSRFWFTLPIYDESASYRAVVEEDRPGRILIVDDEEMVVRAIATILHRSGLNLEVETSLSSAEALVKADTFAPGLVILDLHMPEIGDEQLIDALRKRIDGSGGKILLISGDAGQLASMSQKKKIEGFLTKPFIDSELAQKVANLLDLTI